MSLSVFADDKTDVLSKFDAMNKELNSVNTSVNGVLKSALTSSKLIIDNVTKLEELKRDIDEAEAKKRSAESSKSSCDPTSSEYSYYSNIIDEKRREIESKTKSFNELQDSSKKLLESIKALIPTEYNQTANLVTNTSS